MITAKDLRQKYLDFFKSKGHAVIPSAPLVPENDPTTLFINSGMHPLVPYLMGEKHPLGKRLTDAQKCIRTGDIDEVGDTTHHTFFEMLGNWSLGDYFKKDALEWSWEFLTSPEWLGLDKKRIACSVFEGDEDATFDDEAHKIWLEIGMPEKKIAKLPKKNNWWGPAGVTGPCGPDSEMFYWVGEEDSVPDSFNDDNALWIEIWNDVFMEFNKNEKGEYGKLAAQNVDTGMGLERVLAALNGQSDNYRTELFWPLIQKIEELSGKKYAESDGIKKAMRIISDHIKAAAFIIADGVEPSNTERGYILRRLIRRAIRQGHLLGINKNFTTEIVKVVQNIYGEIYPEILQNKILVELEKEEEKFRKTLENGLKELKRIIDSRIKGFDPAGSNKFIDCKIRVNGRDIFNVYQTYGFPPELSQEVVSDWGIAFDEETMNECKREFEKHQELSRTASAGMFKGGLSDTKEKTTELHTVAHLMLAGLRKVLGENVHQKGSNINGERIRFDFSHPDKMTDEQKKAVEDFVNKAIESKTEVAMEEMTPDEAKNAGAEGEFGHKYGDRVKVYSIGEYSKEICGGPHISNTSEIQGKFKIQKEESSSAGVRRIKAVLI
ncbi:MAG: alanine--tRNA ligase [Candidatus Moraniibacteriota bacterium]